MKQPTKDELKRLIKTRCLLDGCRFGYELFDKKPKDFCVYCGSPRPSDDIYFGGDISNLIK